MQRILFLANERTGSSFLTSFLANRANKDKVSFPAWFSTVPGKACKFLGGDPSKNTIDESIRARPVVSEPEAYLWSPPASCSIDFYNNLPGDDWKFVYLIRDPRNRLESRVRRAVGKDTSKRSFIFKTEIEVAASEFDSISAIRNDPRFYILKFEDLISDPISTMEAVFKFCGFDIDKKACQKIASSFGNISKRGACRWEGWTKEEVVSFKKVLSLHLISFGYEDGLDWDLSKLKKVESKPKIIENPKSKPILKPISKPVSKSESFSPLHKGLFDTLDLIKEDSSLVELKEPSSKPKKKARIKKPSKKD